VSRAGYFLLLFYLGLVAFFVWFWSLVWILVEAL